LGWGEMDVLTAVATRAARISGQLCPHPPVSAHLCPFFNSFRTCYWNADLWGHCQGIWQINQLRVVAFTKQDVEFTITPLPRRQNIASPRVHGVRDR
jgi:hypothetical protein